MAALIKVNKTLKSLHMSHVAVASYSAEQVNSVCFAIRDALKVNNTLEQLYISKNTCLVEQGAGFIGEALMENKSLEYLDLGYVKNVLAEFSVIEALKVNRTLKQLHIVESNRVHAGDGYSEVELDYILGVVNHVRKMGNSALYHVHCIDLKIHPYHDGFLINSPNRNAAFQSDNKAWVIQLNISLMLHSNHPQEQEKRELYRKMLFRMLMEVCKNFSLLDPNLVNIVIDYVAESTNAKTFTHQTLQAVDERAIFQPTVEPLTFMYDQLGNLPNQNNNSLTMLATNVSTPSLSSSETNTSSSLILSRFLMIKPNPSFTRRNDEETKEKSESQLLKSFNK